MFSNSKQLFLLLIFFSFYSISFSQSFSSLSKYEKRWAFFHPFASLKIKKIYTKAYPIYLEQKKTGKPDNYEADGKLDAFRHAYFMALFAQKIKSRKLRKFGEAHEKGNYHQFLNGKLEFGSLADSISSVMDLFNNKVGISIGHQLKRKSLIEMRDEVLNNLSKGKLLYVRRNLAGEYLDCAGSKITKPEKLSWQSTKCLISSDQ